MAENSGVQWTTHTFNPWRGCTKVSPGCKFCYADTLSKRNPSTLAVWGPNGTRVVASESQWKLPIKWNKLAEHYCENCKTNCFQVLMHCTGCGKACRGTPAEKRPRVFCASLADVFEDWQGQVSHSSGLPMWQMYAKNGHPEDWGAGHVLDFPETGESLTLTAIRRRLFKLIDLTPNLDWLILTKRPENIARMMPAYFPGGYIAEAGTMNQEGPRPNVWLGVSCEDQQRADERIPELLKIPAAVRFLSVEPQLGPIDLTRHFRGQMLVEEANKRLSLFKSLRQVSDEMKVDRIEIMNANGKRIDWVICGGESGSQARPFDLAWARSLRDQCRKAGVAYFFKQAGSRPVQDANDGPAVRAWGDTKIKPNGVFVDILLKDSHGGDMAEWPEDLRVREFPKPL